MDKIRFIWIGLMAVIFTVFLSSCNENEPVEPVEQTLIMYFPWSTDLISAFRNNIDDMEKAIADNGLDSQRVVVYFANDRNNATLFEISDDCSETVLKTYSGLDVTEAYGIATVINDIKSIAPANKYSMIIGCHGTGWLPVADTGMAKSARQRPAYHWEGSGKESTRFFGGLYPEDQTEISALREGIEQSGLKMEYILFDDCYMSNVEVAYELRGVTDHLIASTSEIMRYGMPYGIIGKYLLDTPDYENICAGFLDFYSNYSMPCGSIAVTDCRQLDALASIMKEINSRFEFDESRLPLLQKLDGYSPTIFFDMGSYVENLCADQTLLREFNSQMQRVVIAKACTPTIYTNLSKEKITVNSFSGLTISDPTKNTVETAQGLSRTSWYKVTH